MSASSRMQFGDLAIGDDVDAAAPRGVHVERAQRVAQLVERADTGGAAASGGGAAAPKRSGASRSSQTGRCRHPEVHGVDREVDVVDGRPARKPTPSGPSGQRRRPGRSRVRSRARWPRWRSCVAPATSGARAGSPDLRSQARSHVRSAATRRRARGRGRTRRISTVSRSPIRSGRSTERHTRACAHHADDAMLVRTV